MTRSGNLPLRLRRLVLRLTDPRGAKPGGGLGVRAWMVDSFCEHLDRLRRSARAYHAKAGTLDQVLRDLNGVERLAEQLSARLLAAGQFVQVLRLNQGLDALRATVRAVVRARVREVQDDE